MRFESFLHRLSSETRPERGAKERVARRVQERIGAEHSVFETVKNRLTPSDDLRRTIWERTHARLHGDAAGMLEDLRKDMVPPATLRQQIRRRIFPRVEHIPAHASSITGTLFRWSAAVAVLAVLVRISPLVFIATPTVANTDVVLLPTRGDVSIAIGGLWQPVLGELLLEPGMQLRTGDGEASIVLHDNGVIRMDADTTVHLQDLSPRMEPASEAFPTLRLGTGRVWVQGLIPGRLRGITVATSYGHVTVNEGSLSVAQGNQDAVNVDVYDRRAVVSVRGTQAILTAGERVQLRDDSSILVQKISPSGYQVSWVEQNLRRDAVHRHEIAQQQYESRLAQAGILPTSRLYPVKRLAEKVDVLLTFGEQDRVRKELEQAETRLNEAAALIDEGQTADLPLEEYRRTLERLSAQTGSSLAEFLVQRAVSESTAKMAALLPGDTSYIIKVAVLEASAGISDQVAQQEQVQGELLLDGLAGVTEAVEKNDVSVAAKLWLDIQPYLRTLEGEERTMEPSMRKEADALLTFLASSLHDASDRGANVDPALLEDIAAYLPPPPQTTTPVARLDEEDIGEMVIAIKKRIFLYNMTQSRLNQFAQEILSLQGHPDEGSILRRLAQELPDGPESFPARVYKEISRLRWDRAGGEQL